MKEYNKKHPNSDFSKEEIINIFEDENDLKRNLKDKRYTKYF